MIEVPLGRFDIYALALPRGHGFGDQIPHEAWETDDGKALAIITRHAGHGDLGLIVMRRRTDGVWATTCDLLGFVGVDAAKDRARVELRKGEPPEPVPPGIQRRTALYDLEGRAASEIFRILTGTVIAMSPGCSTSSISRCRAPTATGPPTARPGTSIPGSGKPSSSPRSASRDCW